MLTEQVIAFAVPLVVAVSVYLCGRRVAAGWLVGLVAQVGFALYAVLTHHWGWLLQPTLLGPLFARNWLRWRRDEDAHVAEKDEVNRG